ncbi:MAG TPA: hypothetical protein VF680_17025 [Allosphingosinicella sp.]|jgi:hypothetical protein
MFDATHLDGSFLLTNKLKIMKSIELTEEHKSKLLEMCKVLFPDYYQCEDEEYNTIFLYNIKTYMKDNIYIHWFEFCMIHLSEKIYTKKGKIMSGYFNIIHNLNFTKKHIIDYLYEEFKKLNN